MASTVTRILKNTGWLYAKMGITMFISLYTTRLILNSLGASDFGIFNIVGGAISMLGFFNAALAGATQRFMSFSEGEGNKEKQKKIFNVSIILHFVLALLVAILLFFFGFFLFNGILNIPESRLYAGKVIYASLIVSTVLTIVNVPYDAIMNAHENMKYYSIVGVIESLLKLVIAFFCVYTSKDKLIIYGILMACIPLFTLSIMKVYCHKKYDECALSPKLYWDLNVFKEMIGFASWNLLANAVAIVSNSGSGIVMNMFFGTVVNAAQGVSNQINGQLMALTKTISKAINPVVTKTAGKKEYDTLFQMANTTSKVFFFSSSLIAIPAIVSMEPILKLWLKNIPEFAIFFTQCQLLLGLSEQIVTGPFSLIQASGNIKQSNICKSVIKLLYLPIIYYLFKIGCQPTMAYIVLLVLHGLISQVILSPYYAMITMGFDLKKYYFEVFGKSVFSAIIIFLLSLSIANFFSGLYQIVAVFIISIPVYLYIFCTFVLDRFEKEVLKRLYKSARTKIHF